MLHLNTLFKKVNEEFGGRLITLPLALKTWAQAEAWCDELRNLIEPCGLSLAGFSKLLDGFLSETDAQQNTMLQSALTKGLTGRPLAAALLWAICETPHDSLTRALVYAGLDLECLKNSLIAIPVDCDVLETVAAVADKRFSSLAQYGRNLTELARSGVFDDLYSRPKELEQLVLILMKTQRSNAVITGPAGAGKTVLVELLAKAISTGKVPEGLRTSEIYEVSLSSLVAGTMYRGQFEERLEDLLVQACANPEVILFVDELHLLWGAGRTNQSAMDAANILKPYLARGEIRMIGATTTEEYHRYLAEDQALGRRFELLPLAPPSGELLLELVASAAQVVNHKTGILLPTESISSAIILSDRWVPHRSQPDKAINLLDLAAAQARFMGQTSVEPPLLLEILAKQTGQPIRELDVSGRKWLLDMENSINQRLIGQKDAVQAVMQALIYRRQMSEIGTERNLGTFLFAGPTGVGKTELGRILTQEFFGGLDHLLLLDLSEYTHGSAVSRLIGAAPGLVGHEVPGLLPDFLHKVGGGVIIFDEIEKAHPDIRDFLLGMLDNGRVRTSKGELLSTRGCILIVTTNVLKEADLNPGGFGFAGERTEKSSAQLLARHFPPEFLGRFDDLILFHNLSNQDLTDIVNLRLDEAMAAFHHRGVTVHFDREILVEIILRQLEGAGARGVMRAIETHFSQPVAYHALSSQDVTLELVYD